MADFLKAALVYAIKLQWSVLPLHSIKAGKCTCARSDCSSPGKHPLIFNGVRGASKNPKIIKQWCYRWPWANIGIATGKKSGFFVIDLDGEEGADSLRELEAEHGKLPDTIEQVTGSGGRHLLFRYHLGREIANKVSFRPGLDIRGDGGYIVVSPSVHVSGNKYTWEVSSRPLEVEMADPPAWLLELVSKEKRTPAQDEDWPGLIFEIREGVRNETLTRYAGRLLAHGIGGKETLHLILALNAYACKPPLPDEEVTTIVSSICRKELQKLEVKHDGKRQAKEHFST